MAGLRPVPPTDRAECLIQSTTDGGGLIYEKIGEIMRAVGNIPKEDRNAAQNFNYRGIDRVYNACHPLFAQHGVFSTSTILEAKHETRVETTIDKDRKERQRTIIHAIMKMKYTFFAKDGSHICTEVVGEGIDYGGDKASNKAMSIASKYALLQLLMIPTAMVDADSEEEKPKATGPAVQPRAIRIPIEQVRTLSDLWKQMRQKAALSDDEASWHAFVRDACHRDFNPRKASEWTQEDVDAITTTLQSSGVTAEQGAAT